MITRHLVIVYTPGRQSLSDFIEIAEKIERSAADIRVFIINSTAIAADLRQAAATAPTLVISPFALRGTRGYAHYPEFRPLRGAVLAAERLPKMAQLKLLSKASVRVARTIRIGRTTRLSPKEWGEFVVTKPDLGSQGQGVMLVRTSAVRWVDPLSHAPGDPRYGRDILAQQFIDPGERPCGYRVMCFLGRPVYAMMSFGEPIDMKRALAGEAVPAASNTGRREIRLCHDEEVLALARRAAGAFPGMPALGIDILPCVRTRRLYVSEVNPGGDVWHISSSFGLDQQREHGLDYRAQFGALEIIADAMIEATRRLAV
jgi:hypothetical protein